jgi:hypothetical protein
MRIKTQWHKTDKPRTPEQIASVMAATVYRLAEGIVTHLRKNDYSIVSVPQGYSIIAELLAFLIQLADRLAYTRLDDAQRAVFIQALAKRVTDILVDNIREDAPEDTGYDHRAGFIAMLNQRLTDYATFGFEDEKPDFAALRYLGNRIRDIVDKKDQPWIIDQIMDIETPDAIETMKKGMRGLFES